MDSILEVGLPALILVMLAFMAGMIVQVWISAPPSCRTCVERCAPFAVASCEFVPAPQSASGERVLCGCASGVDGGSR